MESETRSMAFGHLNGTDDCRWHLVTFLMLTHDQELWAMAVWVENHHGDAGEDFIARRITQLAQAGEQDGVKLWQDVARRHAQLCERTPRS